MKTYVISLRRVVRVVECRVVTVTGYDRVDAIIEAHNDAHGWQVYSSKASEIEVREVREIPPSERDINESS